MSLIRTFIAVDISPHVAARVAELSDRLRGSGCKATWTKPANLHLSLKFLGDVPDRRVGDVCTAVSEPCSQYSPLTLSFRGVGAFPRDERPRTVWIGVHESTGQFEKLQQAIEDRLHAQGFPRERRRFVPHLTVGRVRGGGPEQQELGKLIQQHAQFDAGSCEIDEVVVYASFLDQTGPTYQVLGRAPLG